MKVGESGFTLLEVLVAALIAALALGVLFKGAGAGVQQVRVADHVQEATARARSRMALLQAGPPPAPGEAAADDGGGYRFRQVVSVAARAPGLSLLDLSVTLAWRMDGSERQVTLHSRRLAQAAPEAP